MKITIFNCDCGPKKKQLIYEMNQNYIFILHSEGKNRHGDEEYGKVSYSKENGKNNYT